MLPQVVSKGNILAFPEAHQSAHAEQGQENVGALRPPVAFTVVSTRVAGAAATAAREGSVLCEGSNRLEEQPAQQAHTNSAAQITQDVAKKTEPAEASCSRRGIREHGTGQSANYDTAGYRVCNACMY
jgi:hypothetical protein